jgi:DNA-binding transcriptional regulator YdaS (Cro superfamily)
MRDTGLLLAIEAAGGIRPLARKLGIDHTSILQWKQIPATRLIAVEAATGVDREILRPDLYRRENAG